MNVDQLGCVTSVFASPPLCLQAETFCVAVLHVHVQMSLFSVLNAVSGDINVLDPP